MCAVNQSSDEECAGANPTRTDRFDEQPYHWFDGDGMLHAVELRDGSARYANRWVQTKRYKSDKARGPDGSYTGELGEFMSGNLMAMMSKEVMTKGDKGMERMGKANTSIVYHAGKLMALEEGDHPYLMAVESDQRQLDLETLGRYSFDQQDGSTHKSLPDNHPFTAHPKIDPNTGELIFFGYRTFPDSDGFHMYHSVVDKYGRLMRTVPIQLRQPVMMHDIAVTAHHSIILDFPLFFGFSGLEFDASMPSRFGVMPRHAESQDQIRWFEAPACFAFHVANAWEHEDSFGNRFITIVAGATDDKDMVVSELETGDICLTEWVLNLSNANDTSESAVPVHSVTRLSPVNMEFPTVNPARMSMPCKYMYFTAQQRETPGAGGAVYKYDVQQREVVGMHEFALPYQKGSLLAGECLFISGSGDEQMEDSGYLMTVATDEITLTSFLYIVDATRMAADAVAIVQLPQRVPFGFHGTWVSSDQMSIH